MKFLRENKIIVLALVIVLLSFGLLALPGQFAHYAANGKNTFFHKMGIIKWKKYLLCCNTAVDGDDGEFQTCNHFRNLFFIIRL